MELCFHVIVQVTVCLSLDYKPPEIKTCVSASFCLPPSIPTFPRSPKALTSVSVPANAQLSEVIKEETINRPQIQCLTQEADYWASQSWEISADDPLVAKKKKPDREPPSSGQGFQELEALLSIF